MILPKTRDLRLTVIRRGGTLSDEWHRLLAIWAAECGRHVLLQFEDAHPGDGRPRLAIESAFAWARGEIAVNQAKYAAWEANNAARDKIRAPKFAALSAGQAAVVAHVPAHALGAAAYALRAVQAASEPDTMKSRWANEWQWQVDQLPDSIRELVLSDQRNRNSICWNVFLA